MITTYRIKLYRGERPESVGGHCFGSSTPFLVTHHPFRARNAAQLAWPGHLYMSVRSASFPRSNASLRQKESIAGGRTVTAKRLLNPPMGSAPGDRTESFLTGE